MRKIFIAVLVWCVVLVGGTHFAEAAVRINEVAWMGTSASSTGEWIELANDAAAPVALSGWRIEADDGSPTIILSGSIGANGYYLIERTNDMTVSGVAADLVTPFGAGLSNSGETLSLKDAARATVDMVVGGNNWSNIGGNNATKETAQRLRGASGWVTGAPTPRTQNIHRALPVETVRPPTPLPVTQKVPLMEGAKTTTKKPAQLPVQKNSPTHGTTTVLWKGDTANVGMSGFFISRNLEYVFLLTGILLSLFAGVIIVRSGQREPALSKEYSIVEDIIEGADD
jgi:hypothetical protein